MDSSLETTRQLKTAKRKFNNCNSLVLAAAILMLCDDYKCQSNIFESMSAENKSVHLAKELICERGMEG
jgi:hypothetical protein